MIKFKHQRKGLLNLTDNRKKLTVLTVIYVVLVLADGLLTYINTPDLSIETNPLISNLKLGWGALIFANIAVFILMYIAAKFSYLEYETVYTEETKFTAYCSQITYDRPDKFWTGIKPKHLAPIFAAIGYAIFPSAIIARLLLVIEWALYTLNSRLYPVYERFRGAFIKGRPDVVIGCIVCLALMLLWFYKEFDRQRKQP